MVLGGIEIVVNQHLQRHEAVKISKHLYLSIYGTSTLILEIKGDYSDVFSFVGVTDESIEACMFSAMKKIEEVINESE